ncbi:unnamed protein product [Linum trigynum]|uniref:Uncharacterized protein n=1 Tax=Linum trigynum TaxID=586398 RepID=A0AAV2FW42_9ROSI
MRESFVALIARFDLFLGQRQMAKGEGLKVEHANVRAPPSPPMTSMEQPAPPVTAAVQPASGQQLPVEEPLPTLVYAPVKIMNTEPTIPSFFIVPILNAIVETPDNLAS